MRRLRVVECVMTLLCLLCPLVLVAGPLSPPDPPAPTMKTIEEAAPGVPLTRADIPLTITESGLYYFTEDLIVPAGVPQGISIEVPNVTIDLRGFTLWGPGKDNQLGYCTGIQATGLGQPSNVRVMNGFVDGFSGSGVSLRQHSLIEDLHVRNIRDTALLADVGSVIRRCFISESGSDLLSSRVIAGSWLTIEDNDISNCEAYRAIINTSAGTVRRNRIQTVTLRAEGPAEEDLASVNVGDIPAVIRGGVLVEDNIILDQLINFDNRWCASILAEDGARVARNHVEVSRAARALGIVCTSVSSLVPVVEDNIIRSTPNTSLELQVGIWVRAADARITGNDVVMAASSTKRMDGILLTGSKNLVADNKITIDRRVDNHAGIRVMTGRNMITGNRISSLSVASFAALVSLSFEGGGSSNFSTNYYGGNIMEGVIFEEAGPASNNIQGSTPAPNVLF